MATWEERLSANQVVVENTSGSAKTIGTWILEQGYLGNVVERQLLTTVDAAKGVADGENGYIDVSLDRVVQTDQITVANSFAWSNAALNSVYFDSVTLLFTDTAGANTVGPVGYLTPDGSKDSNNVIAFKPSQLEGLS